MNLLVRKSDQLLSLYIAVDRPLKCTLSLDRFLKPALSFDRFFFLWRNRKIMNSALQNIFLKQNVHVFQDERYDDELRGVRKGI